MNTHETKIFHGLELLHYCGGGAFGEVYYCRDISGRALAVKIISKQKLGEAWQRELKGVINYGRITEKSPELLQIFHVEEDADSFFYTMEAADTASENEYLPDTLAGRLQHGSLKPDSLFEILAGIFNGIKTIHDAGFAHRDIKPENIIFIKGIPKLGDIGLVSSLSATATQIAGTMDFIPPEQRTGAVTSSRELRQKSDLYAFGKVIYCTVTGNSAADFPSVPNTLESSAAIKYFLRLSYRLCDNETLRRIENLAELEHELKEIQRKLMQGETWKDEFQYKISSARLFWKSFFFRFFDTMKKHPLVAGGLFLFMITGGCFGVRLFRTFSDSDTAEEAKAIQEMKKKDRKTSAELTTYSFVYGRYSIAVPRNWIYQSKEQLVQQRIKQLYGKKKMPEWEPGNTRYQLRDSIAFFYPRKPTEKMNTVLTVERLPVTENELVKIPDSGLTRKLQPYIGKIRNMTLRRFENPRNNCLTIFANGHLSNGSGYMAYLYPAKDHTIMFSIALAEKYAQQDQSAFWQIMDTFARKKVQKTNPEEYAALGTPAELERMLAKGTDIESGDADGRSLFMIALESQNFKNAAFLLKKGADINSTAYNHSTALMIAVDNDQAESVRFLLKNGADPEIKDDFGNTPLTHAVIQKKADILRLLVAGGANVNVRFAQNSPILFEAVVQTGPEITEILLSAPGLDLNQCDAAGRNVLLSLLYWRLLTKYPSNGCEKILIEHGIKLDFQDPDGNTALMFAAELGDRELAEQLLRHGADKSIRNKKGHTASDYCKNAGLKKILQ